MMRIAICTDHAAFALKEHIAKLLTIAGFEVVDYGAYQLNMKDDYPDFVIPLAKAVAEHEVERGIAFCGSGIGVCIAANKVVGARAALIHDIFSAHQGVEDDDANIACLGSKVIGYALAEELIRRFLSARFSGAERYERRLTKIAEHENTGSQDLSAWGIKM